MEPPQDQPLKTSNNGQMGEVVEEETGNQNWESRQTPDLQTAAEPCVKQENSGWAPPLTQSQEGSAAVPRYALRKREEEPHETHSFNWCWNGKSTAITNKAGTLESLLNTSQRFKRIANLNKNKELVILRDGKAICSHFPGSLIKKETLTIKYIKAVDEPTQSVSSSDHRHREGPSAQNLPDVLLKHFGFLPQSGGICIIGHPDGKVKKIDPCFIVPTETRNQVVERHWHENPDGVEPYNPKYFENQAPIELITRRFFEDAKNDEQNGQALSYETCFYFLSSGSPVFDEHCNVVAMHSGGYAYKNASRERRSIIEYGYSLSIIIERIVVQMREGRSRYMQAFINAVSQPVTNESLKKFLEFLSRREVHVPMDTD